MTLPYICQLPLPLGLDEEGLRRHLEWGVKKPVALVLTENARSLLYVRQAGGGLSVRLHRMFLGASEEVLSELADYIGGRRKDTPRFWEFVRENEGALKAPRPRRQRRRTRGARFDLGEVFERLNAEYFGGELSCALTWGQRPRRGRARSRTLGSYSAHSNLIRMSPLLDRPGVPCYYVEFVLYHEMLHASLGRSGRSRPHGREFQSLEREFKHYARALAWEKRREGGR